VSGVASRLKERVTIEQRQVVADTFGGQTVVWVALATVFAEVLPLSGTRERLVGEQVQAVAGYRVHIRARSDVDASMRLQWNGRVLQIHSLHEHDTTMEILTYEEQL